MYKESLYNRIETLFNTMAKKRYYLPKLYKFEDVVTDLSPNKDMRFIFNSRYGKAEILMYKEKEIAFSYWGDIEFEKRLTKSITCSKIEDNRIRELELYIYNVFGVPEREKSLKEKFEDFVCGLKKNLIKFGIR